MPGLIWDGTSSFGSGEAELKCSWSRLVVSYVCLNLALGPKTFDISSALHEGRRGVLMEFLNEVSSWRQLERV
ncbi:hypothetical protein HID58_087572 [Brassica napus]|uniref:Uncharacterized protein n=1 Tax=Brassica napus TaxID=3708 RepID=A0ABQ7XTV0_BRANA|nr:hypothetical protein HID58_087572 [Brassica napus]